MSARLHLAVFALLAAGAPAMAQQLDPEQAGLLEQAREAALQYSASLPDFICTEVVRRTHDPRGNGRWQDLDTLTVKLSYFGHREDYKLMEIDGRPTVLEYESVAGAVSAGEFGTRLYSVFDPRSHGEFRWKGWSTLRQRRVARFSYRIARESSTYWLLFRPLQAGRRDAVIVAYHGDVYVDMETRMVLRLTLRAEIPHGFAISRNESSVDYEFAEVGGKPYLLPSHAYSSAKNGSYEAENNVEFLEYRKFHTESTLTFDPPPQKQ
jgi:hypothetical protein